MHRSLVELMSAMAAAVVIASPSLASPFVYTSGGLLSGDLNTCMKQARRAATQTGFTSDQEEVLDDDKKDGQFFASKPDAPLSATVRCFPTAGVFSLAVGGINNAITYEQFKAFVDAYYKE
jgi:hypothetical protein